ncbi:MAG TPA: alpha/beta fold hydrolase [Deinococcales bacterium]|nr:alpha/beta fold hydrolase [Deinococcales bacterium]
MTSETGSTDAGLNATGGYAGVNGLRMYHESRGSGRPLVLVHGGFGSTAMFDHLAPALARKRRVVALDLQAHGRTADIDRDADAAALGDDIAALVEALDLGPVDLLGYSLGGLAAQQAAYRHPEAVRSLIVVSSPFKREGWYPEVREGMNQVGEAAAAGMAGTPMHRHYQAVAPRPDDFPRLAARVGRLVRAEYDWTEQVRALQVPALLVFADGDSISPAHAAEFFALLGGGQRDAGWDGSGQPRSALAILPRASHYNILHSPLLSGAIEAFLA